MAAAAQASIKDEEFEPLVETVQEKDCLTILLYLPGFKKENLRVQLTTDAKLRVSGEKKAEDNKVIRFRKEFVVSSDTDTKRISAKFERGILYIRLPKMAPEGKQDTKLIIPESPTPQKPADSKPESSRPAVESRGSQKPAGEPEQSQKPAEKPDISRPTDESRGSQKPTNEPQQFQKPAVEAQRQETIQQKTADKTSPIDGPSKQTDVQDVTQKKPEKEGAKAEDMRDKGTGETVDGSGKTIVHSCKGTAVDLVAKLKMSRRLMTVVLVVLLAVVIGLYISNFIRGFRRTTEN